MDDITTKAKMNLLQIGGNIMTDSAKRLIFYFEDDPNSLKAHIKVLEKRYAVIIGAEQALVDQQRSRCFDLVVIDIMIHHLSLPYNPTAEHTVAGDSNEEVINTKFGNVGWRRTGLEFLRLIRNGQYADSGFKRDVPVIVTTAVVNYPARQEAIKLGIAGYLEKPFSTTDLEEAVVQALASGSA
jgi:CheY-like chemotaxis protein